MCVYIYTCLLFFVASSPGGIIKFLKLKWSGVVVFIMGGGLKIRN